MLYFEWDPVKAAKNLRDHGVSFAAARVALEDAWAIEEIDQIVDREVRLRTIGMAPGDWSWWYLIPTAVKKRKAMKLRVSSMQGRPVPGRGENMSEYVRVAAGTPLSNEELAELRALAQMPDSEIDYSDIPERIYTTSEVQSLPLEEHTLRLRVDSEVAEWLDSIAPEDAPRINLILKRAARRSKSSFSTKSAQLHKAS